YKVDVTLNVAEMLDDEDMPVSNGEREERSEGEFSITAITDNAGNFVSPRDLEIRLQTLPTDEGYWLDTGVVNAAN
ncbi:virulence factor SrfB, partial [Desulfovibrio sp.]